MLIVNESLKSNNLNIDEIFKKLKPINEQLEKHETDIERLDSLITDHSSLIKEL